jgi:repressor LexA
MSLSVKPNDSSSSPNQTLTPRQHQILRFVAESRSKNGYSPTLQEMALILELSKVTVFEHVAALVRKGLLLRQPNRARSLTLNPDFDWTEFAIPTEPTVEEATTPDRSREAEGGEFSLLGDIAAGCPLEAVENPDRLDLKTMFETHTDTFALQVSGESMINEHIQSGDYVLVKKTHQVSDGQTVVALMENGEATLKKVYREGKGYRLEGANAHFEPIYTDELQIQGVVIGLVRCYS